MKTLITRIIVGFVIAILMMLVRKAAAADLTFTNSGNLAAWEYPTYVTKVTVRNTGSATLWLKPGLAGSGNAMAGTALAIAFVDPFDSADQWQWTMRGTSDGASLAPGAVREFSFNVLRRFYDPQLTNKAVSGVFNFTSYSSSSGATPRAHSLPYSFTMTTGSGAQSMAPNPFVIAPELSVSQDPPVGKVTVMADSRAAGPSSSRSIEFTTPAGRIPVFLVEGSNMVFETNNPSAYNGTVTVRQNNEVIGYSDIVKDPYGGFHVEMFASGVPVVARVTVKATEEVTGPGRLLYQGWELHPQNFTFTGAATNEVFEWETPASIADGTAVTVEMQVTPPGTGAAPTWQKVGGAVVQKDDMGGWNIVITCTGDGNSPESSGPDDAVFILDALVYDKGAKSVSLEIDGQTYQATPTTMQGAPGEGTRTVYRVVISNAGGTLAGKEYSWKVTGKHEGKAVRGMIIAGGSTPQPVMFANDNGITDWGFVARENAIVGSPEESYDPDPPPPPDNPFDPEAPIDPEDPQKEEKQEMVRDYQSTRKAMEDSLNLPDTVSTEDTSEADALMKNLTDAYGQRVSDGESIAEVIVAPQVGSLTGSVSSLTFSLPVMGAYTFNAAVLDPWPSYLRNLLLGLLGFVSLIAATKVVTAAFKTD